MKKTASILLIGILAFNWVGYHLFSSYMESRENQKMEAQLDENNFDENQLVSIKIPAAQIATYTNNGEFERIDGQVEINGILYKYVKRRQFNDSLEYLCIPNQQVMKLHNAKEDFFRLVNDLQHNGQGKKAGDHNSQSKAFSLDNFTTSNNYYSLDRFSVGISNNLCDYSENLSSIYSLTAEQPPDHC